MTDLRSKTLAYIESNPAAAQATLNMLSVTPLVITHSLILAQLLKNKYDFLLIGAPIPVTSSMVQHNNTLLAALKDPGAVISIADRCRTVKAAGRTRLPNQTDHQQSPIPTAADGGTTAPQTQPQRKRLPLVMAVNDNLANLKLIGTLLAEQVEQTLLCESGEETLALARDNVLDLILMNIQIDPPTTAP